MTLISLFKSILHIIFKPKMKIIKYSKTFKARKILIKANI